eukprot:TRINITY_DN29638_c0_g2_i1.p1 TRINITY_DN29638_c0_g2~~TRINITY_DN29638_c0_g2_i1.p1  ORF type:complete len:229 (+),score=72.97 TRINITY_DN29638_c0_g2_i1:39-725(+)
MGEEAIQRCRLRELEHQESCQHSELAVVRQRLAESCAAGKQASAERRLLLSRDREAEEAYSGKLTALRSSLDESRKAAALAEQRLQGFEEEQRSEASLAALRDSQKRHLQAMKEEADSQQCAWLERARRLRQYVAEGRAGQEKLKAELQEAKTEAEAAEAALMQSQKLEAEVQHRQAELAQQRAVLQTEDAEASRLELKCCVGSPMKISSSAQLAVSDSPLRLRLSTT